MGEVNSKEVLVDAVAGGSVGRIAGNIAGKAAKNSSTGQVLAKQANRAERIAANSTRKARQDAAAKATEKAENYVASRGTAAGTTSSGVASDAAKKTILKDEKTKN